LELSRRVVWREKEKGGVASRPSPQSPKGILGLPPPLLKEVQAESQTYLLCL
jgi:hypothetical protein